MLVNALLLALGLVLLVVGAEALVRGASRLARALGISPLVIGLTVVAFGTSMPELVVSVTAALRGAEGADLAIGNVVGSNIFNIAAILGVSAIALPLTVERRIVRMDVPVMLAATLALVAFAWDGTIDRGEASALLVGFAASLWITFQGMKPPGDTLPEEKTHVLIDVALVAVGIGLLVGGGHLVVTAAVAMARALGVSELVIGLTIVAAGTSLPELATSAVASMRGQPDIAVGNVVGSNVFNVLLILGVSGAIVPLHVREELFRFDLPVLVGLTVASWPLLGYGKTFGRKRGLALVAAYVVVTAFWVLNARASGG